MTLRTFRTIALATMVAPLIAACTVKTPENLAKVEVGTGNSGGTDNGGIAATTPAQTGERADPDAELEIAKVALHAWRTALAHPQKAVGQADADWQKQLDADEKAAIAELNDLLKRHPTSSTVYMMLGQVEEHFGKRKEAVHFLEQSIDNNTVNSISLFKLAENERQLGNYKSAAAHYKRLLKSDPDFLPGMIGEADCLSKDNPAEAGRLAQAVLDSKESNEQLNAEARRILKEIKGGRTSH